MSTGAQSCFNFCLFLSLFFLCVSLLEHPGKQLETIPVVEYTEKSQEKQESRHVQLVREYGFHPRSKVQVVDGSLLPRKFEPFPSHMYGKPLEEIDQFIYEEVSKQVTNFFFLPYLLLLILYPYTYIIKYTYWSPEQLWLLTWMSIYVNWFIFKTYTFIDTTYVYMFQFNSNKAAKGK